MYDYRDLELDWPMGSLWDLPELLRGYDRLKAISDIIVPEHDWRFVPSGVIG